MVVDDQLHQFPRPSDVTVTGSVLTTVTTINSLHNSHQLDHFICLNGVGGGNVVVVVVVVLLVSL